MRWLAGIMARIRMGMAKLGTWGGQIAHGAWDGTFGWAWDIGTSFTENTAEAVGRSWRRTEANAPMTAAGLKFAGAAGIGIASLPFKLLGGLSSAGGGGHSTPAPERTPTKSVKSDFGPTPKKSAGPNKEFGKRVADGLVIKASVAETEKIATAYIKASPVERQDMMQELLRLESIDQKVLLTRFLSHSPYVNESDDKVLSEFRKEKMAFTKAREKHLKSLNNSGSLHKADVEAHKARVEAAPAPAASNMAMSAIVSEGFSLKDNVAAKIQAQYGEKLKEDRDLEAGATITAA